MTTLAETHSDPPSDELDLQMQAIEKKRRAAILSLSSGIATFILVAFIGEFTLANPIEIGAFELTKGHVYLLAPLLSMIVAAIVFSKTRPKTQSFLDDGSIVVRDANGPRDLEAEEAAGIASGRKALQAKLAAFATFVTTSIVGYLAVDIYYTSVNEAPRENPWEYVPRLRIEIGEVATIGLVGVILAFVVQRVLAPAKPRLATESLEMDGEMDGDTEALFGEVQRNTRKAQMATLAGGVTGLIAAAIAFYVLVEMLEPRSVFDLRLLFGTTFAGLLVGGAIRKMLLPDSMRAEGALDVAKLPAGNSDTLLRELGMSFTLSRNTSLLDLAGLGSRSPAHYDLLAGGGLVGFVRETGSPALPMLLGSERPFVWMVSDAESRVLHVRKAAFGSELTIENPSGQKVGHIRRSRIPFVRTLVIEAGVTLRLSKRWFSKNYVVRSGSDSLAEVRLLETKDDMGVPTRRVDVELQSPEAALPVLAGVLAMDAL